MDKPCINCGTQYSQEYLNNIHRLEFDLICLCGTCVKIDTCLCKFAGVISREEYVNSFCNKCINYLKSLGYQHKDSNQ